MQYVYLDQNHWIDLRGRSEDDEVRESIEQAVEEENIVIPLISTLLRETGKYGEVEEREKHFDFMYELSQGYGLREYMAIGGFEIDRFVATMDGYAYDLVGQVRGRGVDHLYGDWTLKVDGETEIDDKTMQELEKEFEKELKSKRGFDVATKRDDIIEHYQESGWEEELAEKVNEIREEWDEKFNDNKKRRRFAFYRYFSDNVFPELLQKLYRRGVNYDFGIYNFEKYVPEGDETVDSLLQWFPSRYSYVALNNAKDLQKSRDAKPNDIYDIFSLAVAIPYCDVVVTEKFWATEAKRAALDEIYNTEILSSIDKVPTVLN